MAWRSDTPTIEVRHFQRDGGHSVVCGVRQSVFTSLQRDKFKRQHCLCRFQAQVGLDERDEGCSLAVFKVPSMERSAVRSVVSTNRIVASPSVVQFLDQVPTDAFNKGKVGCDAEVRPSRPSLLLDHDGAFSIEQSRQVGCIHPMNITRGR